MEEAEQARAAAREAITDVTPDGLQTVIDDHVVSSSMLPGVLTLLSARVVDGAVDEHAIAQRAAGVQLIYDGLRVTRGLVSAEPWATAGTPDDPGDDLDILAADVLVARGFRLLARTEAADQAVETVRAFGREQTDRHADRAPTDRCLEANVFELAAIAGGSATGSDPPVALRQYLVGLADNHGEPLPAAADALPERVAEIMARVGSVQSDDRVGTPPGIER